MHISFACAVQFHAAEFLSRDQIVPTFTQVHLWMMVRLGTESTQPAMLLATYQLVSIATAATIRLIIMFTAAQCRSLPKVSKRSVE